MEVGLTCGGAEPRGGPEGNRTGRKDEHREVSPGCSGNGEETRQRGALVGDKVGGGFKPVTLDKLSLLGCFGLVLLRAGIWTRGRIKTLSQRFVYFLESIRGHGGCHFSLSLPSPHPLLSPPVS